MRDAGHTSEPRPQHFGISQGCPLSPFLFSIVMTVLLFDASAKFAMEVETRQPCVLLVNELVYADDTLVVATDPCRAETHMRCIEAMGMNFGLRLNWKKCGVLPIGCEASIAALTEVTLHANHPSHIWEVIWMPLALVARKSAGDWAKPKVNSTNWRESGGILPCTPNKRSVSSKLVSCQSCCIACTQCG